MSSTQVQLVNQVTLEPAKNTTVSYQILVGQQITPYTAEIGKLVNEVYAEWPYLYQGSTEEMQEYMQSRYINVEKGVVCVAIDQGKLIGLAMGAPLANAPPHYRAHITPETFGLPLDQIFYWGELIVNPEYRKQQIAQQLSTQIMEAIIKPAGYQALAFCTVERGADFHLSHLQPKQYWAPDAVWVREGYIKRPDLTFKAHWKLLGAEQEADHPMVYWFKKL